MYVRARRILVRLLKIYLDRSFLAAAQRFYPRITRINTNLLLNSKDITNI
jgi:hypothetical protein